MFSSTVEHFVRDIERISILKNNEEKNNEIKLLFVELNKTAFNDADKIALKEVLEKYGLIESADITNLISILENENLKSIICVCEEGNKAKSAATQDNIEKKIADYFLNQLNDLKEKLKTVTNEEQKDHEDYLEKAIAFCKNFHDKKVATDYSKMTLTKTLAKIFSETFAQLNIIMMTFHPDLNVTLGVVISSDSDSTDSVNGVPVETLGYPINPVVAQSETRKIQEAEIETKKQKQDSLYALMYVLWQNARKNNSEQKIVEISDKIKSLLQSYETPTQVLALLNELSEEVTESDGITTHTVLYWLTDALSLATDKNPQAVSQICDIIRLIFQKSFDVDLLAYCLKKGKPTDDFYDALFDDLLENKRTDIPLRKLKGLLSEPLKAYLKRTDYEKLTEINASENKNSILIQLIDYRTLRLSSSQSETRKVLEAKIEAKKPTDHLYTLMYTLFQNAKENNSAEITRISDEIKLLLQSNETPDQILALLVGLSEKKAASNVVAACNALDCLMHSLSWAVAKNLENVSQICGVIEALLNKCTTEKQVQQLLFGLSEKKTAGEFSALSGLMVALSLAERRDPQAFSSICGVITALLNKCTIGEQVQGLLIGLFEKLRVEEFGPNSLYCLVAMLYTGRKTPENIFQICSVIKAILNQCTIDEQVQQLLIGLSKKKKENEFYVGRNALYDLMFALSLAVTANSENVSQICSVIEALLNKCNTDEQVQRLLIGLSEESDSHENALYRLMRALLWASDKNLENVSQICSVIEALLNKCNTDEQVQRLLIGLSEKGDNHENALYFLMIALSWASDKNLENVSQICNIIILVFQKSFDIDFLAHCLEKVKSKDAFYDALFEDLLKNKRTNDIPLHKLKVFLSEPLKAYLKRTSYEKLTEINASENKNSILVQLIDYRTIRLSSSQSETRKVLEAKIEAKKPSPLCNLMNALFQNTIENNSAEIVRISDEIKYLLQPNETPEKVLTLLIGLSERITVGDFAGRNALYCLMNALSGAAKKDPQAVSSICDVIATLLNRCTKDEQVQQLLSGLSEKRTAGNFAGRNALYCLMNALSWAVQLNSQAVSPICGVIEALLNKCTTDEQVKQLLGGLSAKQTAGDVAGSNALFDLMSALSCAAEKNPQAVSSICGVIAKLLNRCTTDEQVQQLLSRLSEKRTAGNFAGRNALYCLMNALSWAAQLNSQAVSPICGVIEALLNKCTTDEQVKQLLSGLSEKQTAGDFAGSNALYQLMRAVLSAVESNSQAVSPICGVIATLLSKCTKDEQVQQLLSGLSEKITVGNFAGRNALFDLMNALVWAAQLNSQAVSPICGVIATLLNQCTKDEQVKQLLSGLSEKQTAGNDSGKNALYLLMGAFSQEIKINANKNSNAPISNLISKLILKFFNLSVVNDERIFENLAQFLTQLLNIQDCSPKNELLSQVIQLLQRNINVYSTEQREKIQGIFKSCQKEFTWVPVAVTPVVEVKDTPVKPVIPAEPVESQPPSYDELFPGIFENDAFFFWIDNLNKAPVSRPVTTIQEQLQQPHPLDEFFTSEPSAVLHAQQTVTDEPNTLLPAALMEQQVPKIEREERRVMPKEEAEKLTLATTALKRQGSGLFGHLPVVNVETHSDADLLRNQLNSVTIPTDALPVSQDEHRALCN